MKPKPMETVIVSTAYIRSLNNEIQELKDQLAEANEVITSYIRNFPLEKYSPAEAYVDRWGVK